MTVGIYYFSGTGNTAFIANTVKTLLSQTSTDGTTQAMTVDVYEISDNPPIPPNLDLLIIGGPIYAGNMPEKLIRWVIRKVPQNTGKTKVLLYSTSAGLLNAFGVDSLASKLNKKGYDVLAKHCFEMPRNFYFGSYEAHSADEIQRRLDATKKDLLPIIERIRNNEILQVEPMAITPQGLLSKDLMAELFSVMAKFMGKNFKTDHNCVRCGKCTDTCPQHNIQLTAEGIKHGFNCMMCTKCLHICPKNAILYKGQKYVQYNTLL